MRLTNKFIAELSTSEHMRFYSDYVIPRLMLTLQSNGKKFWHLRVETPIGDTTVVIGNFPDLDVTAAREKANKILERSNGITDLNVPIEKDKVPVSSAKSDLTLSKIIKARDKSNFRPNPMFKNPKNGLTNASEIKRKEQAKRDFFLKSQQHAEIERAWQSYKKNHDVSSLLPILRDDYFTSNFMPNGMGKELAKFLESAVPEVKNKDDNHIFLTYWRHTEFKTNVQQLIMNTQAVEECVAFMEAIGRQMDHATIKLRIKKAYEKWRKDNAEKLAKASRILKDLDLQAGDKETALNTKTD